MKKIIILSLLLIGCAFAKEETILLLDSPVNTINYAEDDNSLINYDDMKKAQKVKEGQMEYDSQKSPKIKLDTREINHQRALNYTTRFNDTMMLPTFN